MTYNNVTQHNTFRKAAYRHLKGQETEPFIQKAVISVPKFHYMDERSAEQTQDILSFLCRTCQTAWYYMNDGPDRLSHPYQFIIHSYPTNYHDTIRNY
jgi:hypothetical protein